MDDLDQIICVSLRELGLELADDVVTLRQVVALPDMVIRAAIACIQAIDPARKFPRTLPRGTSQKVQLGTEIATCVRALGYRDDLSYHQLLYPNEVDARRVLAWLVEQLPKDGTGRADDASSGVLLNRQAEEALRTVHKLAYVLPAAQQRRYLHVYPFAAAPITSCFLPGPRSSKYRALEAFIRTTVPPITAQPPQRWQVTASVLELSALSLIAQREREAERKLIGTKNPLVHRRERREAISKVMHGIIGASVRSAHAQGFNMDQRRQRVALSKQTRFSHMVGFSDHDDVVAPETQRSAGASREETEAKAAEDRAAAVADLDAQVAGAHSLSEQLQREIAEFTAGLRQTEANIAAAQARIAALTLEYQTKRRVATLLADPETNIRKLTELKQQSSQRLLTLGTEWEAHRVPLIEEYRKLLADQSGTGDETSKKLEKLKTIRAEIEKLHESMATKDERLQQLLTVLASVPKDINRAYYTRRILDAVKNVHRQMADITKVLIDARSLKKEIATIEGTLGRAYSILDEQIYRDAPRDASAKQAYKDFVAIDRAFKQLILQREETGRTRNECLQTEAKIEAIQQRTNAEEAQRLQSDLRLIKKENAELAAALGTS